MSGEHEPAQTLSLSFVFKCWNLNNNNHNKTIYIYLETETEPEWEVPVIPQMLRMAGNEAKAGSGQLNSNFHRSDKNLTVIVVVCQDLHWFQVGVRYWNWELNPDTPMWDRGISILRLYLYCPFRNFCTKLSQPPKTHSPHISIPY